MSSCQSCSSQHSHSQIFCEANTTPLEASEPSSGKYSIKACIESGLAGSHAIITRTGTLASQGCGGASDSLQDVILLTLEDIIKSTIDTDYIVPTPDIIGAIPGDPGTPATPGSGAIDIITDLEELGGEDPFTDTAPGSILFRVDLEAQTVTYHVVNNIAADPPTTVTFAAATGTVNGPGVRIQLASGVFTLSVYRAVSNAPGSLSRQIVFNGEDLAAVALAAPQSAVEAIVTATLYDTTNTVYPNTFVIDYANPTAATTPPDFPTPLTYRHSFEISPTTPTNTTTTYLRVYTTERVAADPGTPATPAVPGTPDQVIYDPSDPPTSQEFQDFLNEYYTEGTPNPSAQAQVACLASILFTSLVAAVRTESQLADSTSFCGSGKSFGVCPKFCSGSLEIKIN